ncbi:MAG: glycosyltransferase [Dehalococcoidia bacterium]|nr:glycosyltransferase [Dehalococcoidia bacterium]
MKLFVIFPARNESKTIARCVETARKSKYEPEILVIDGNSSDETRVEAKNAGAIVIKQSQSIFPAKGRAMKDGLKEAFSRGADYIVFLDADIVNLTPEWVDLLAEPVIEKACDMCRGYYRRADYDGAVTKLVAKPLSSVFFPEVAYFNQPLSGEICATSELFKALLNSKDWPDGWGIDMWLLIEAAMKDYYVAEVYLGTKVHTSRQDYLNDVVRLAKMAEQVALTTFKEAIKHKRVDNVKKLHL